jgi:endonuclease YncB( thermonuclease family)
LAYEAARQARATQWTNYLDILNPVGLIQNVLGGGAIAQGDLAIANLDLRAAEIEAARDDEKIKVSELILAHLTAYESTSQDLSLSQQRFITFSTRVQLIESDYRKGRYSTEIMLPLWEERDRLELEVTAKENALRSIKSRLLAILYSPEDYAPTDSEVNDVNPESTEEVSAPYIPPATPVIATVQRISDGDTITVITRTGQRLQIRLACIDAPEKSQPGGATATEHLKTIIPINSTVQLKIVDTDRYGRQVAEVYTNGELVQLKQLQAGTVFVFDRYLKNCGNPAALQAAEAQAKQSRIGVWADPNTLKPWEYRAKK